MFWWCHWHVLENSVCHQKKVKKNFLFRKYFLIHKTAKNLKIYEKVIFLYVFEVPLGCSGKIVSAIKKS
jgi:hypothetical protein